MPVYEYRCTECGHEYEIHQSFSDEPITECPECGGKLKKVYGNVGIAFKGSGFYVNDSGAKKASSSTSSSSTSDGTSESTTNGSSDAATKDSGAKTAPDTKPAKPKTKKPKAATAKSD